MSAAATGLSPKADELSDYYDSLDQFNLAALWTRLKGLVPGEPTAVAVPHQWRFDDIYPELLRAGELITAEEAERRVLVLENPAFSGRSQITDTLYTGVQLLLPGEIAPAHRHTQSALRFVLRGHGAYTTVDGERAMMRPGDFIITPHWTWHDHGHDGDEPVAWLDGLDVPLVTFLRSGFREDHQSATHSITRPDGDALARFGMGLAPIDAVASRTSPIFSYPYARTREALDVLSRSSDIDPHFGIRLRYINPTNGDWAIPTIGTSMTLLPRGFATRAYRSTDGLVVTPTEGTIKLTVGAKNFVAEPRDVVVIPAWTSWTAEAADGDAVFFGFSDRPVHEKLGLFRESRG